MRRPALTSGFPKASRQGKAATSPGRGAPANRGWRRPTWALCETNVSIAATRAEPRGFRRASGRIPSAPPRPAKAQAEGQRGRDREGRRGHRYRRQDRGSRGAQGIHAGPGRGDAAIKVGDEVEYSSSASRTRSARRCCRATRRASRAGSALREGVREWSASTASSSTRSRAATRSTSTAPSPSCRAAKSISAWSAT